MADLDEVVEDLMKMVERAKKVDDAIDAAQGQPDATDEIRAALLLRDKPRMIPLIDDEEMAKAAAKEKAVLDGVMLGEDLADYITGG